MENTISKIKSMCQNHPYSIKIVLIPFGSLKTQIFKVLSDNDIRTFNLELMTVDELAIDIVSAKIHKDCCITIDSTNEADVIREIMVDLNSQNKLKYFNKLEASGGICDALAKTFHEIKCSKFPEWDKIKIPEKKEDIITLLHQYNDTLAKRKYMDRADILLAATKEAEENKSYRYDNVLVLPGCRFNRAEKDLIEIICTDKSYMTNYFNEKKDKLLKITDCKKQWESIEFFKSYGRYAEAKAILRYVIINEIPLDKVCIVAVNEGSYMNTFFNLLEKYCEDIDIQDFPLTIGGGLPVSQAGPARLLMAILRWISDGYRAKDFLGLFTAGSIKIEQSEDDIHFGRMSLINIIKSSDLKWQRSTYIPALEKFAENLNTNSSRLYSVNWLISFLKDTLFQYIPEADSTNQIEASVMANGLKMVLKNIVKITSPIDSLGLKAVIEELDSILVEKRISSSEFCEIMEKRLKERRIMAESPHPGKLHLQKYNCAEWVQREYTFLIGCDYDSFPSITAEDPILLDIERWESLPKSTDTTNYNMDDVVRFISSVKGKLIASFPYYDTENYRDLYPGFIYSTLTDIANVSLENIPSEDMIISDLKNAIDEEDVVILNSTKIDTINTAGKEEVKDVVLQGGEGLDVRNKDEMLSASSIIVFLQCGYRYYLQYILKLKQLSDVKTDILGWMSHIQIGNLYHEIFEHFISEAIKDNELMKHENKAVKLILKIAEDTIRRYDNELPVASRLHTEKQKQEILDNVKMFAENEVFANDGYVPVSVEYEFGGDEGLRIILPNKEHVVVKGYIDRLDYNKSTDSYRIIDYKTGSTFGYDKVEQEGLNDKKIQPVLYYLALKSNDNLKTIGVAQYRFVTRKGDYERIDINFDKDSVDTYKNELEKVLDMMASGKYLPSEDKKLCVYCPYCNMCRYTSTNVYGG